jgi:hypothetical protein
LALQAQVAAAAARLAVNFLALVEPQPSARALEELQGHSLQPEAEAAVGYS